MSFQPHTFIPDFGPDYRFDDSGKERANCLGSDDFNTTTLQLKGPTQLVNYDGKCTEFTDEYKRWECLKRSGKATFAYSIGTLLTGKGGTRKARTTWCFKIIPAPPNHGRTYFLQAESRQEMEDWMDSIAAAALASDGVETAEFRRRNVPI